jgi:pyruvate,water dikinase
MLKMKYIKHFTEINKSDLPLVGGKGLNLGLLTQEGFLVPDGFCITTEAYWKVEGSLNACSVPLLDAVEIQQELSDKIVNAYNTIGAGRVAVRSSATAEDLPDASFAGQQDTFLNVQGATQLLDAVKRCWASLWSERAIAYRRNQNIDDSKIAMSVVVQKMIDSDVSGVMFTVNPQGAKFGIRNAECRIVIESSFGLGEAIVSGKVSPDHFVVDRNSLDIIEKIVSRKQFMITQEGEIAIPESKQTQSSLNDEQVKNLAHLGLEIESFYGAPQDIEWAFADGNFYILQARPITTLQFGIRNSEFGIEKLRQEEIETLQAKADPAGTVWSSFNLSEVLPAPLPMTWGIIKKFMSGRGGFGLTYRDLGFIPSKDVDEHGVLDLICGRVYFNLSREAKLYFNEFPMEHNFEELKNDPQKAIYPKATVNIKRSTAKFWLKFPYYVYKMMTSESKIKRIRKDFDRVLTERIFPKFCQYTEEQRQIDLTKLSDQQVLDKLNEWIHETLTIFSRDALKASVFAGLSYTNLETAIVKCFGEEHRERAKALIVGLEGDLTVDMNLKMWEVAQGQLSLEDFLDEYGHRAVGEFELAQPRWREDDSFVQKMIKIFQNSEETRQEPRSPTNPVERFNIQKAARQKAEQELDSLREEARGQEGKEARRQEGKTARGQGSASRQVGRSAAVMRQQIAKELEFTQRYMPFRETAKFYIMLGYELIRKSLLELDRRFNLNGDIFYLTPEELPLLTEGHSATSTVFLERCLDCENGNGKQECLPYEIAGQRVNGLISQRKHRREQLLKIDLPEVIFSDSLEEIGERTSPHPPAPHPSPHNPQPPLVRGTCGEGLGVRSKTKFSHSSLQGLSVSAGAAEGIASVVLNPANAPISKTNYVIVCPSTDPAWTPLFLNACALVMERGGMLSHGAVVAREYGIPAVVNIPNATKLIKDGQKIRVDGNRGVVAFLET